MNIKEDNIPSNFSAISGLNYLNVNDGPLTK